MASPEIPLPIQNQIPPQNQNGSIITINQPISTKLTQTNFLTWKAQILPIIHGYELDRFLLPAPAEQTEQEKSLWRRQDQFILGWIFSSLTENIQSQVSSCLTTADLWTMLTQIFSSASRARVTELRRQLQTAQKGSSSCTDYLKHMKHIADELRFAGLPLPDEDLITNVLSGLGPEFNPFVITLTTASRHAAPLSFAEVHSYLVSHEQLLQRQSNTTSLPSINSPSAYIVRSGQRPVYNNHKQPYYNQNPRPNNTNHYRPPNPHQYRPGFAPQYRPNHTPTPGQQQPRPWNPNPTFDQNNSPLTEAKPQCQICTKFGHTAKICYFRYNPDKANSKSPSTYHAYVAQPTASYETASDWILDSGATNHVTSDINNISSFYAYDGTDNLQIGPPHQDYSSSSSMH